MRSRGVAVAAVLAAAAVAMLAVDACDALDVPADPLPPFNRCDSDAQCASWYPGLDTTCDPGFRACVRGPFDTVAVISLPDDSPFAPREDFVVALTYGDTSSTNLPDLQNVACGSGLCSALPRLNTTSGVVSVAPTTAANVWSPAGLRPNVPKDAGVETVTSLPVDVTFHPLWTDPSSQGLREARDLGLPVEDSYSVRTAPPTPPAPTNGTVDGTGVGFVVEVPSSSSVPKATVVHYDIELRPSAPYDPFPPVLVSQVPVTTGSALLNIGIGQQGQPSVTGVTYTLQLDPGSPALSGWWLYLVDAHERRISSLGVLKGTSGEQVVLHPPLVTTGTQQALVLRPPAGSGALPYVRIDAQGTDHFIPTTIHLAGLPAPVLVRGSVTSQADPTRRAQADIVFDAPAYSVQALSPNIPYAYRTRVSTDADGNYEVSLPPGDYKAYVIPRDPDLALTVLDAKVGSEYPVINGRGLAVAARAHLRGQAVAPGGVPLSFATVVIGPEPAADRLLESAADPLAVPRPVTVTTGLDGSFDAMVDAGLGTAFDVSVRPAPTTQFPWVVMPSVTVDRTDVTLPDVLVPPPYIVRSALIDPSGTARIGHAIVRAYAFPKAGDADAGAPPTRGARLLGEASTGDDGSYTLYLSPPLP